MRNAQPLTNKYGSPKILAMVNVSPCHRCESGLLFLSTVMFITRGHWFQVRVRGLERVQERTFLPIGRLESRTHCPVGWGRQRLSPSIHEHLNCHDLEGFGLSTSQWDECGWLAWLGWNCFYTLRIKGKSQ